MGGRCLCHACPAPAPQGCQQPLPGCHPTCPLARSFHTVSSSLRAPTASGTTRSSLPGLQALPGPSGAPGSHPAGAAWMSPHCVQGSKPKLRWETCVVPLARGYLLHPNPKFSPPNFCLNFLPSNSNAQLPTREQALIHMVSNPTPRPVAPTVPAPLGTARPLSTCLHGMAPRRRAARPWDEHLQLSQAVFAKVGSLA